MSAHSDPHQRLDAGVAGADDPGAPAARDPRREAQAVVGDRFDARVLEPSPPAVLEGDLFADDPVAVEPDRPADRPVVGPVAADLTWDQWLGDHPEHRGWAAARWLGAHRRLPALPAAYPSTRLAVHRLVVYVVSPARQRANGRMALRFTYGGLGTPFFGADEQVRVAGDRLVHQRGDQAVAERISTLARAADVVLDGPPDLAWAQGFDVPEAGDLDGQLPVDPAAAAFLGDWTGFAWSVLEQVRADAESAQPSRTQLWAEHFDAAFDCLPPERRVTLGASPGDADHDEPYLYVLPHDFDPAPAGAFWNADTFRGAILRFGDLAGEADQRAAACAFLREGRDLLGR
ncbi:MAG TPA: hypothetical protein VKG45_15980 [Actinomycetes bacterium]|nr:hypothetical protein [Actinomycetes bacterium]